MCEFHLTRSRKFSRIITFLMVLFLYPPRIIKVLPKSDMAIVWIDIWDTQNGSNTKMIINRHFNVGSFIAMV